MSATQYCAYAFVTTVGVGVAEGVGVGLALVGVADGVGVGDGEGEELHPLKSNTTATDEAAKDTEIRDFFMHQIYLVLAGVAHEMEM